MRQELTVGEAARQSGWSPRMLRYIERVGLLDAPRSDSGYRLYGAPELQRLRTLRELLQEFDVGLGDMAFAQRLRADADLRGSIDGWFAAEAQRPADIAERGWLAAYSRRRDIRPGISCSASWISLRPNPARDRSATL